MNALVAESQVSEALNIGTKAVRLQAVKNNWPVVKKKKQGGNELFFVRDLLPVKVQRSLVDQRAVSGSGVPVILHDRPVPKRSKKIGLAKYNLVHAFRLEKERAGWGAKAQAAQDFLLAYNSGVLMPSVFEVVGPIKERTLDALDKRLRDNNDDYLCLCDGRGGWQKHGTNKYKGRNISEYAKSVFLKCYLNQQRPTVIMAIRSTWMALEGEKHPEKPGESTLRRWLRDWSQRNAHVICMAREGMKAYVDQYGPYGTRDANLLEVGQCLVADGKTLNFFIQHPVTKRPVRMKLIVFFDWKSRYPAGWQIMPEENTVAVLAAFRDAVDRLGRYPDCVYLDNGKAFKNKVFMETDPDLEALTGLYARVGTAVTFAAPYNGRAKVVERFFKTVQDQLEWIVPSYCGNDIDSKPAWMARNEKFHRKWHEARTNGWIPTVREAAHIIDVYFKWYAQQPHKDLPAPPEEIFLSGQGPGVDPVQLNHDFLWRVEMSPRNCRVRLWNIDYESDCLHGLARGNKITGMFSMSDMSRIWCYTEDGDYLGEALPVQAMHPLANLFGGQVAIDQVKSHNKRLAKMKKQARQTLADLGISHESQDMLNVLPFAQKAPVLPQPEQPAPAKKQTEQISEKQIKRLAAITEKARHEKEQAPVIERPKFWTSDLSHYEWCFEVANKHRQPLTDEDLSFMTAFEAAPEFEAYRRRFEDLKLIYNPKKKEVK